MAEQPKRTLKIALSINEGYDSLISEDIRVPADADLTLIGTMIERRVGGMLETVADFYPRPEPPTPIAVESRVS